jgi:hypothetical protein
MIVVSSIAFLFNGPAKPINPANNPRLVPPIAFFAKQTAAFSSSMAKYWGWAVHVISSDLEME